MLDEVDTFLWNQEKMRNLIGPVIAGCMDSAFRTSPHVPAGGLFRRAVHRTSDRAALSACPARSYELLECCERNELFVMLVSKLSKGRRPLGETELFCSTWERT